MQYLRLDARLSQCETYRYLLMRNWSEKHLLGIVMLNPSTADALKDDNTIRRCVAFADSWGYGGIVVGNLFAYRATSPAKLSQVLDPVGPENFNYLKKMVAQVAHVLCAWGRHGSYLGQGKKMVEFLAPYSKSFCLGLNKDGSPKHPLYVRASSLLRPF